MPRAGLDRRLVAMLLAATFTAVALPACAPRPTGNDMLANTGMRRAAAEDPATDGSADGNMTGSGGISDAALRDRIGRISRRPSLSDMAVLRAALDSPDAEVRRLAVHGLALLGHASAIVDLLRLTRTDPSARVVDAAHDGLRAFPPEEVERIRLRTDPLHQQRDEQFETDIARRDAGTRRRVERQAPPVDEAQMIAWASDLEGDVGFWVEGSKIQLVKDHAPIGHPLGYNGKANAGELLEYRLTITNASLDPRLSSSAFCYTYDPWVTVINRELMLPVMKPGETRTLPDTLLVLVSPDAPAEHRAQLFLEIGDTRLDSSHEGRPVYRAFYITFTNPGIGRVEFSFDAVDDDSWGESDGNGNGIAEWSERVELTAHVLNYGPDTMRDTHLQMQSSSSLVKVVPAVTAASGNIPPGGRAPLSGTFAIQMAHGYTGTFDIPVTLTLRVPLPEAGHDVNETRAYVNPEAASQAPTRYYTFKQAATLHIGVGGKNGGATLNGPPRLYQPFDPASLTKVFVLSDSRDLQKDWLADTEARFLDARDASTLEAE